MNPKRIPRIIAIHRAVAKNSTLFVEVLGAGTGIPREPSTCNYS